MIIYNHIQTNHDFILKQEDLNDNLSATITQQWLSF